METGPQGKYVWVMNPANDTVAMRPVNVLRSYKAPKRCRRSGHWQRVAAGRDGDFGGADASHAGSKGSTA